MPKIRNKNTKSVRWSTQGGYFNSNYTRKVEILLSELDEMKSVTYNLHVYDSQENHRYDMILGPNILSEIKIDLFFSDNIIRGNEGAYKVCTTLME